MTVGERRARSRAPGCGRGRACVAVGLAALLGVSCSSDPKPSTGSLPSAPIKAGTAPLRIEDIGPAIDAVESALGGPQQFFEVNATPTLVNLFVAESEGTQAVAYVYAAGALQPPAAPQPANGPTFSGDAAAFDVTTVLSVAVQQLPGSDFRLFSVAGSPPQFSVTVDSAQGSEFLIYVDGSGKVLGTDQALLAGES